MQNKNIVILGAGESGVGAAVLAKKQGYNVFVSDFGKIKAQYLQRLLSENIDYEEGKHTESIILNADEIIKSPGIPDKSLIISKIQEKGISIIDELEFASRYTNAIKICVTGSNGKTTTSSLIYHILKKAGLNVGLAGNIGKSFALQVAENEFEIYVLEISSFQLDYMFDFKAEIAILTNITPDHLDRYDYKFENYIHSKFKICNNQTPDDYFIYSSDDEITVRYLDKYKINSTKIPFSFFNKTREMGAYIDNKKIIFNIKSNTFDMDLEALAIQGRHNVYNSMAAGISSKILDIRNDLIKESLSDFQGVEHRLEPVAKVHGIEFINDSKATNINSTWYALECMTKPVVWIVGGQDKGNDYRSLRQLVKEKVKAIVCLGIDNTKIIETFSDLVPNIIETKTAKEAVENAYYLADSDEVVLLSPACASFDLFDNYEDRGLQFRKAVNDL